MKKDHQKANRLIHETSPYLQQHAYNPVDWYPWGEDALERAKAEDKPILVSIGYSTCHWCHVMERESFEDEQVAAYMNEHFINIKVDREERPDVDAIYMEAVQLVQNGQGGWPLNCFLLPNGRPFFGGTYFPPRAAYQRASWMDVLGNLKNAFDTRREEVEAQANKILNYIKKSQEHFAGSLELDAVAASFDKALLKTAFENLQNSFDGEDGGFGGAPKFPGVMALRFCYNYYLAETDETARQHLLFSLDKMAMGGIYDHLGGGFARYTVDARWLVPHFEKMLYDNALLVGLLADVYKLEAKPLYRQRIEETLEWIEREMLSPEGGFYAALDADSEGVEGKFYVWDKVEIETVLGEDSALFCKYYDVTEHGNWEEKNILNMDWSTAEFIQKNKLNIEEQAFEIFLKNARKKLLQERAKRIRPGLDDKILLDWNAMMISAYCKAYQALKIEAYKNTAVRALNLLLNKLKVAEDGLHLYHSYKDGQAKHHAFLDDYALLIEALLEVYTISQDKSYLNLAQEYADFATNEFLDFQDNLYYFTSAKQQDIILHKKSLYDSATPSGNATMVHNLQRLGILLDENQYRKQAERTLAVVRDSIERYPLSFGRWANALFLEVYPLRTIHVGGADSDEVIQNLLTNNLFNTVVEKDTKKEITTTQIVVCKDYTCNLPVSTVEEALNLL